MAPVDEEHLPFWFDEGQRPGATPSEIDFAEQYIGHRLPASLRNLLLRQNGGVSNFSGYQNGDVYCPLLPIFGVDRNSNTGMLMPAADLQRWFGIPNGVVPFAGDGHSWLGLDYRSDPKTPSIVFRQDEEHEVETVASSFDELLNGLVEE